MRKECTVVTHAGAAFIAATVGVVALSRSVLGRTGILSGHVLPLMLTTAAGVWLGGTVIRFRSP